MSGNTEYIGKNIICNRAGIGEIIDVAPLHNGGEEFYKVTFPKDKCTNYFSVDNKKNYRIVSSKELLTKAIAEFNSDYKKIVYKTTQEKINIQRELLKEGNIIKLAKSLSIMNMEKDLHAQVSKPYKESLNTFIEEIAFVLDISKTEAYSLLGLKAPKKNKK